MKAAVPKSIGNSLAPWRFLLFIGVLIIAAGITNMVMQPWQKAILVAFDVASSVFLISLWPVINDKNIANIKRHAAQNDANRGLLLVFAFIIVTVLLVTIAMELSAAGKPSALLIVGTLILAWLFSNTIYALHYAHLYHGEKPVGHGLSFAGKAEPDYWDFVYFACTLGMTFQTSDIVITDPAIRRVALAQSFAAFLFNIGVLAFTINILGG